MRKKIIKKQFIKKKTLIKYPRNKSVHINKNTKIFYGGGNNYNIHNNNNFNEPPKIHTSKISLV